jgi:hypothetical protein
MRTVHDSSPWFWTSLAAGAATVALATCGFFLVVWFLTHSD